MALTALICGDDRLDALALLTPQLAEPALSAAAALVAGDSSLRLTRVEAERARLVELPGAEELRLRWSGSALPLRPLPPGLRRLIAACSRSIELPPPLDRLIGPTALELLSELTVSLLRRGSRAERWAVRLLARGPVLLCRETPIDPRLAPAVVWVGQALRDEPDLLEVLEGSWPSELSRALKVVERGLGELAPWPRAVLADLRHELEGELLAHG